MRWTRLIRHVMLAVALATLVVVPPLALGRAFRPDAAPSAAAPESVPAPLTGLAHASHEAPVAKVDPALRASAAAGSARSVRLVVTSDRVLDLAPFGHGVQAFTWPAGEHVTLLSAPASAILTIAALPGVAAVSSGEPRARPRRSTPGASAKGLPRAAVAHPSVGADPAHRPVAAADGAPREASTSGGAAPTGWWDVGDGHGGRDAWAQGYRGAGVRVGVLDTGIDFAHPDLQGTWAVVPPGQAYAGWPQVYDPYSTYYYVLDHAPDGGASYTRNGYGGLVAMDQTSPVQTRSVNGLTVATACFKPLIWTNPDADERTLGAADCDYIVPESKSGTLRYGHHPDTFLAAPSADTPDVPGEFPGVLLVDAHTAGVYDTVYVDLDGDHDFTNDKPVTQADPVSARDLDGDQIPDVSGGLLYWIADGQQPVPGAYLWGLTADKPAAGSYVALMVDNGEHGTLCASNIASQGRLGVPPGIDLHFRNLPGGQPEALNPALAPEAKLVAVGDVYGPDVLYETAWRYAVLGDDPTRPDDDIQVTSNSYGWEEVENEGWDMRTRYIDYYVRTFNPHTTFLFATGNGAPGYGTDSAPLPVTGVAVGASTQIGQTGWDSITDTAQITFGDITAFSDRGPVSDGRVGVDVAADGAWGAGAEPLNLNYTSDRPDGFRTGAAALATWGGTSRSAPVATAGMALVYQAYRAQHGQWPDWRTARALLMAGARFSGYDAYSAGAGVLDAGDAVRVASGGGGLYAEPATWTPGNFRGLHAPGFAHLLRPGESETQVITFTNPGPAPIDAALSTQWLKRLAYYEDAVTTDAGGESPYNPNVPDYIKAIDRNRVPLGTDLMVVRFIYPLSELDPQGDLSADNDFRPGILQHTDINGDGKLWNDTNHNGVVNHVSVTTTLTGLDLDPATVWPTSELERWEYARFDSSGAESDTAAISVHHPVERWKDGLYVALWHRQQLDADGNVVPPTVRTTHIRYRVEFYSYADWDWLVLGKRQVTVPAGGQTTVVTTLHVPVQAPPGAYQGALFADYARGAGDTPVPAGGGYERPGRRLTIPIAVNVSARYDWHGSVSLGNNAANDSEQSYNNGAVRGHFDWGWRAESGDWRFFYLDDTATPPPGTWWLMKTAWSDPSRHQTDIDTRLWGPQPDRFTNPNDPANHDQQMADPSWYGPYTLGKIGESDYLWEGDGRWPFNTATGTNEDWVAGPAASGLTEVMLQNVLYSGAQFEVPFTVQVSSLRLEPSPLTLHADRCLAVTVTSQVDMSGLSMQAIGLAGPPEVLRDQPVHQDDPNDPATASYRHPVVLAGPATRFGVTLSGPAAADLDLYVLYDANGDGTVNFPDDVVGSSAGSTADEAVTLVGLQPAGRYEIWVHGYKVAGGPATADLTVDVVAGNDLQLKNVPPTLTAGKPATFGICPRGVSGLSSPRRGTLLLGPGVAPSAVRVPLTWDAQLARPEIYLPWLGGKSAYFLPR